MKELNILSALKLHAARYPLMQPQDAVKLLYQYNFGGGHLISDTSASLKYLRKELETVDADAGAELFEPCGGDVFRLNLAAAKFGGIPAEEINHVFVRSAEIKTGSLADFKALIDILSANFDSLGFEPDVAEIIRHPVRKDDEAANEIRAFIIDSLSGIDERITVHDLRVVDLSSGRKVLFDVAAPYELEMSDGEIASKIAGILKEEYPEYDSLITVDRV